jgi:hypothetical protein
VARLVRWSAGSLAFGAVVDDLVHGITEFRRQPRRLSYRWSEVPAAVGCVPWMSSEKVTAALGTLDAICIVTDKGGRDQRAANKPAGDRESVAD